MANVLGTLFQDIADAIRTKTGSADTMKPAEFPEEIANIPVGGGALSGEWVSAKGSISRTENEEKGGIVTVAHGLGVVPDIIVLFMSNSGSGAPNKGHTVFAFAISKKLFGDLDSAIYSASMFFNMSNGSGITAVGSSSAAGIETLTSGSFSGIYDVNAVSFTCGHPDYSLYPSSFAWGAYAMK